MRLSLQTSVGIVGICLLATGVPAPAADAPDLSKIERRIAKEPKYVAQPLYGLYVFGPEAKTHVWAVLDKSTANGPTYDVLYFDRNANGDLTDVGERIEGKGEPATFKIGEITDPATRETHTDLILTYTPGPNEMVMLRMKWKGKHGTVGGYAEKPGPYTQFAKKAADAPILWPGADGPLSFQRWMWDKLAIGEASDVRVFLGHQGLGTSTFCGMSQDFLPKEVPVLATLIYTDVNGKEQRVSNELRERC